VIFNRHVTDRFAPYLDGSLDSRMRDSVEAHLAKCAECRTGVDQVRKVKAALQEIPLFEAPESLWTTIEASQHGIGKAQSATFPNWRYAVAALIVFVALLGYWRHSRQLIVRWEVVALDGLPIAGGEPIVALESVPTGEWIETDARSRARIRVGEIGSVELEPNTRVRLMASGVGGHRLALRSGGISAKISAPPRLFIVDAPAGTAVDLGCEYRIHCDRYGTGTLSVSQGWVSLEWLRTESLVPAGASCRMRAGLGPGTPWFEDAPTQFAQALERFDFDPNSALDAIETILTYSRTRDTLTLWHLLSRVRASDRPRVYHRIVKLAGTPAGIDRETILNLDRHALARWKDELAWTW